MSEYTKRDHTAQGEHYLRHVSAMTGEGLHTKSAIAGELAHRDIEIERLTDDYAAATHLLAGRDAQIERLTAELATLRAAIDSIKAHCVGDMRPNWDSGENTYRSRGWIADTCDAARGAQQSREPLTNIVVDVIDGYKAGLAGEPMGFVSEAFDCGWSTGNSERAHNIRSEG